VQDSDSGSRGEISMLQIEQKQEPEKKREQIDREMLSMHKDRENERER